MNFREPETFVLQSRILHNKAGAPYPCAAAQDQTVARSEQGCGSGRWACTRLLLCEWWASTHAAPFV